MKVEIDITLKHGDDTLSTIREIWRGVGNLLRGQERTMATLQEVRDAVANEAAEVVAGIAALQAKIQELQDQLNNGTVVTAADLDELKAQVEAIFIPTPPAV